MNLKVYSQVPFSLTTELDAVVAFFKPYIALTYEIIPCKLPVAITSYKSVQGFNPVTGKPSLVKYYGLTDTIRKNFKADTDIVMFAWDINVLPAPTDGAVTSWTMNVPLSLKTDFIQLAVNQYIKNTGGITNRITHEICHALCFKANRAGIPTLDEMDITSDGKPFYLNDTPLAKNGNYARTLSNLQLYFKHAVSPVTSFSVQNTISQQGLELIASFEGLRLSPYTDSAGVWTVGYGSTYGLDGKRITSKTPPIKQQDALGLLEKAIMDVCTFINRNCTAKLTQNQFDAMCSLAYNIGVGNLQKSNLLKNLNSGKSVIKDNFLSWNRAGGHVIKGLTLRRKKEWELFNK